MHITSLTAWVNKDGSLHFRDDIYGRDAILAEALALQEAASYIGGGAFDEPATLERKGSSSPIAGPLSLIDTLMAMGRKGLAIQRYKGLGEMNPDTLWTTTMDPEIRTLLQVRAEDHAEADQMFTTLMGDQVEPRRKFIEDNALDVRNLDV